MTEFSSHGRIPRFALRELLEFTTLAAVVAAFAGQIGPLAATMLMLFAVSMAFRQGALAMACMTLALSATDSMTIGNADSGSGIDRQFIVFALAVLTSLWRRLTVGVADNRSFAYTPARN